VSAMSQEHHLRWIKDELVAAEVECVVLRGGRGGRGRGGGGRGGGRGEGRVSFRGRQRMGGTERKKWRLREGQRRIFV
jgi:hypothetical protein